jgi:predicted dienelactone hydrolase
VDAYKWILNNLNSTLKTDLDTSKVAVLGWSAGGTSALYLVGLLSSFASQSTKVLIHTSETGSRRSQSWPPKSHLPCTDLSKGANE